MFIENYLYENCLFSITKENGQYWAKCQEIVTYSNSLSDLKNNKIPEKYHSCRVFKL